MSLNNTTIIPANDIAEAQKQLDEMVRDPNTLLLVVLGNDDNAQKAVECADVRAGTIVAGFKRKIAWAQDKVYFKDNLYAGMGVSAGATDFSVDRLDDVVAFSLSLNKIIKDVVKTGETIDYVRMEQAFLEAGKKEEKTDGTHE